VEEELDRLQEEGIIEQVQYTEWAAPIVPVLIAALRICGDFKATVNKASKLDRYPIPKVEDLFAALSQGTSFTKLDVRQAYQQIKLDDDSKKYVVVNTHKGLFCYNRLRCGVLPALGIFQQVMECFLKDIPRVVVYLDDLLLTGPSVDEHLSTLNKVL